MIKNNKILFIINKSQLSLYSTLGLLFLNSIFDFIGVGFIGPLIAYILSKSDNSLSIKLIILSLIFLTLRFFISVLILKNNSNFTEKITVKLRELILNNYSVMDFKNYINYSNSYKVELLNNIIPQLSHNVILPLLRLLGDVMIVIALALYLFYMYSTEVIILSGFGFFLYLYIIYINKRVSKYSNNCHEATLVVQRNNHDYVENYKYLKISNLLSYVSKIITDASKIYALNQSKYYYYITLPKHLVEFLFLSFIIISLYFLILINKSKSDIFIYITTFGYAGMRLMPISYSITNNLIQFKYHKLNIDKIYDQIKTINLNVGKNFNGVVNKIELIDVSFLYKTRKKYLIKNLNLEINKGDIVGIFGLSGSGKSTLIDIISGLVKPTSGLIKINDEVTSYSLFNNISYLPQSPYIMNTTLYENITLGNKAIKTSDVQSIIKKVNLDEFVNTELQNGLDTVINGANLDISGGQRQRIAIARLFCSDKEILILDEPTSALDEYNENSILELISSKNNKTTIIISHKRKIINICNSVYEFQNNQFYKIK